LAPQPAWSSAVRVRVRVRVGAAARLVVLEGATPLAPAAHNLPMLIDARRLVRLRVRVRLRV
jgi:hypothetical protein